ncbi:type VI secretion system protein [Oceanobacter mangrovi]|uniref:type VI secretion system protein n=1 Tax=Oceanobacter mangrovi TaxID=2862510 RepID=UPI001C8DBE3A|nr:type VI secretion system protein [Oceanobacter mangrovi]
MEPINSAAEQTLQQQGESLLGQFHTLLVQLDQRMQPLVTDLEPIWSDPLWQFIGLILLAVVALVVVVWLLRSFRDALMSTLGLLSSSVSKVFTSLVSLKPNNTSQGDSSASRSRGLARVGIKQALDVLRYLTTRRDWRYQSPWYLLAGTDNSGRHDWATSVQTGLRAQLLAREKSLPASGSQWHFFDQGVLIEVEQEQQFSQQLELLNFYRPERPLDGLILTISAKALLAADDPVARRSLGESLYRQIWQVQKQTCFVVPVYLQVTECEHITGFDAFWSTVSKEHPNEMFGWSNPARLDAAYSPQWILEAFNSLVSGIRETQLQQAADGDSIKNIDEFMLFDRQFQNLERPLQDVLSYTFARSSYQEAPPLRGIWFSGKVGDEVALTDDFLNHKLWLESNLAYPVERRRFSINRTLRHAQYATLAGTVLLVLLLIYDTTRLHNYSTNAEASWQEISQRKEDCSDSGGATWWLLSSLTKISEQPLTLSLPASWGAGQMPALENEVVKRIFPEQLFSGMDCRLHARAETLNQLSVDTSGTLEQTSARLETYIAQLGRYQQAQQAFIRLAGPIPNDAGVANDFRALLDYLYDSSIPSTIDFNSPLIADALIKTAYNINWSEQDLVDPDRQLRHLNSLSTAVRLQLQQRATQPPVDAIQRAFFTDQTDLISEQQQLAMTQSLAGFHSWLVYVQQEWLDTSARTSPCGELQKQLGGLLPILQDAGYPDQLKQPFDDNSCDRSIRQQLATLDIPPMGPMFQQQQDGQLDFSPRLLRWKDEFGALSSLNFIRHSTLGEAATDNNNGRIVGWNVQPLDDAMDMLLDFQTFSQQWWPVIDGKPKEPFYASTIRNLLIHSVRQRIEQAQIRDHSGSSPQQLSNTDTETNLTNQISSFSRASSRISQLLTLLQQEQDSSNYALLQTSSQQFVSQQFELLNQLVLENRLYMPLRNPQWSSDNFATALFSYSDPADLDSYLQNQRERVDYLAHQYARPLVAFLLDSSGITPTDQQAALWLGTLKDLQRYQRKEPGNQVALLESYIGTDLSQLDSAECNDWLAKPAFSHLSSGLFASSHYSIDEQVRSYCQQYGKNSVLKSYLALAASFNQSLAGHFPFAPLSEAGISDIAPENLQIFFSEYDQRWGSQAIERPLASRLTELMKAQPSLQLGSWLAFVQQLDQLSQVWKFGQSSDGSLNLSLKVEFAALPEQAVGMEQIVQWTLSSGANSIIYPNGNTQLGWHPDDALTLRLRWASGSAVVPTRTTNLPVDIDSNQRKASFSSKSRWGLFEWLARFGSQNSRIHQRSWLTFQVPVAPAAASTQVQWSAGSSPQSYTSKVNLLMSITARQTDGRIYTLTPPSVFPQRAPGVAATTAASPHSSGGSDLANNQ